MKKNSVLFTVLLFTFSTLYSKNGEGFTHYQTEDDFIFAISFTKKGEAIGIGDKESVKVFHTSSGEFIREFAGGHRNKILSIDISADSTLLVSGGRDSTIVLWDFTDGSVLKSLPHHRGIVTSVRISPCGKYILSGGTDNNVHLYDIERDNITAVFSDHSDDISSVEFSYCGKLFASAGGDRLINIYDLESLRPVNSLKGHRSWVRDISFSRDGKRLISCGDDSRIIVWNIEDTGNIREISRKRSGFQWQLSVDFHEDSRTYVHGGISGNVEVNNPLDNYNVKIRTPLHRVIFRPGTGPVFMVAVATRGKGAKLIDFQRF